MKITVAPPLGVPRSLSKAAEGALSPAPESTDPLAFTRRIHFGNDSEIDEAGVALVDLSVLIYRPLDTIQRVFAKVGVMPTAIDAYFDRGPDFVWLESQARAKAFAKALSSAPPISSKPKATAASTLSPLDEKLAQLRAAVDTASASRPTGSTQESANLQQLRDELAKLLRTYMVVVPATDAEIGRDWRNRAPRVIAFRHGSDAYIAFRGSATPLDWKRDFMFWPADRRPLRHKGFDVTWTEVRAHVEAWLAQATRELGSRPTVHIGGHSLAGAVATLAAVDLATVGYPIARVVTIGSPRVGGRAFRELYRSTTAAPDVSGKPRFLDQVTTRFVHGTDAFSMLPPPPFAVHVVPPLALKAEDRLNVEDFAGQGLLDTAPLIALVSGASTLPAVGYTGGVAPTKPVGRVNLLRAATTQAATWTAMLFPAIWWTRLLPFLPAVVEQTRVSFGQHRSARYWAFLPPTILRSALATVLMSSKGLSPSLRRSSQPSVKP
ncbi:MAG: lipase family protein [Candidatus Rokubacteria bacterium]|nr:lipase family protein [Candidatus Rokubacteria bacterium]